MCARRHVWPVHVGEGARVSLCACMQLLSLFVQSTRMCLWCAAASTHASGRVCMGALLRVHADMCLCGGTD
jgi:hypothetical protein